jgi:dCTP deaminase
MSILLGEEIKEKYKEGKIHISPYNESQVGPNSYDVRLGNTLKRYLDYDYDKGQWKECILDVKKPNKTKTIVIPDSGLVLEPGKLYLGTTVEEAGSDYFVPMYEGRSSLARLGVMSHLSAGFGDIGFKAKWTLEISVMQKIRIYPGMRIGQVYFHNVNQKYNIPENRYQGKYQTQSDPQESKSYLDYSDTKYN